MPIREWLRRMVDDPQVVGFVLLLTVAIAILYFFGGVLTPVIAAIIIAYLLEGLVNWLVQRGLRRWLAVLIVFLLFLVSLAGLYIAVIPVLQDQVAEFYQQLPSWLSRLQQSLKNIPQAYPALLSEQDVDRLVDSLRSELVDFGQSVIRTSFDSIVQVVVNLVLVPFMVFFLLKDKDSILSQVKRLFPKERALATRVWHDVDEQIGNYLRGKVWEILIIWGCSAGVFALLGLKVPMLIGLVVGLSVLVPYVGVAVMTIPVALTAFLQWGFTSDFFAVMIAYAVIQVIDGNVLAPLLLSEVVQLHPLAIIVAILIFGGIWGFWGVFFAVPLATLVRAVFRAWPRIEPLENETDRAEEKSA